MESAARSDKAAHGGGDMREGGTCREASRALSALRPRSNSLWDQVSLPDLGSREAASVSSPIPFT